jgi:hypothetical protein
MSYRSGHSSSSNPPKKRSPSPARRTSPRKGKSPSPPRTKSRTPSPEASVAYQVYRVEYIGTPNHESIFIETNEDGPKTGHRYHVVGSILNGMTYEHKKARQPESSATYATKQYLGTIAVATYRAVDGICRSIAVPGAQMNLRGQRLRPNEPLRRCGEWTKDAIQALRASGVLRD